MGAASLASASSSGTEGSRGCRDNAEDALSSLVRALKASRSCIVNRSNDGERKEKRQRLENDHRHCYEELELPLDIDHLMAESDQHLRDPDDQDGGSNEYSISDREGEVGRGSECSHRPDDNDDDHDDFVWDRPIFLKDFYARHGGLQRSETALPSIVIFNLALANHLSAIGTIRTVAREGDNGCEEGTARVVAADDAAARERLRKAAELYQLSLQLQTMGSPSTQFGELLLLSCLNNLGSAHGLLGDDRSEECANGKLLATLMYLTTSSSSDDEKPTRQAARCEHRYEPFFRNVFKKETSNKAPAA